MTREELEGFLWKQLSTAPEGSQTFIVDLARLLHESISAREAKNKMGNRVHQSAC